MQLTFSKIKTSLSFFLIFILLLMPSFAIEFEGNTRSYAEKLMDEGKKEIEGYNSEIAKSLARTVLPASATIGAFFMKVNDLVDFLTDLVMTIIILTLFVVVQYIIIKIWKLLVKIILKIYLFYQIMTKPNSDVEDIIKLVKHNYSDLSQKAKRKLKSSKKNYLKTTQKISSLLELFK